ncbi:hypothetical protein [Ekhidna sp. To15]|uniref:hypothetical protein n=1 Tax=Ekhidna sp. To15 TaxID=3395267 RepID=UPI003F5213E1
MRYIVTLLLLIILGCKESYDVPNHTPGVVRIFDNLLMTAYGEGGLIISNVNTGEIITQVFPPQGMNSIDDFDMDGNLIFVLDSRGRDYIAVFSFDGINTSLVADPIAVEGGPFNGVSASNGNLVVSGGTTFLNRFKYSSKGKIFGAVSFGRDRGHPDVLLSDDGQAAFISTDFDGGVNGFGVTSLYIGDRLQIPFILSELRILESGITTGVTAPVGFPIQTAIYNDNLIVAHGGGLTIINLIEGHIFGSNSNIDIGISGISLAIDDNIAYVIGYQGEIPTLVTVDLSDISNPPTVSTTSLFTDGSIPTSIAVSNTEIYIAAGAAGLLILPK